MKAVARRVPIQEACLPPVNFADHCYLGVIDYSALKDELNFNVPAWNTLPNSGNAPVALWGLLLQKSRRVCFYFFFRILSSRPRLRYSTSSMKCLIR
jgi:hypothetical protein